MKQFKPFLMMFFLNLLLSIPGFSQEVDIMKGELIFLKDEKTINIEFTYEKMMVGDDGKEENFILIDTKNKKITIQSKTGDVHLEAKETVSIKAKNIKMDSEQNTTSKAGSNIKHEASSNVDIKAGGQITIDAGGTCTVKGSTINLN